MTDARTATPTSNGVRTVPRRVVLVAAAAVGAGGLVTACGDGGDSGAPPTTGTEEGTGTAESPPEASDEGGGAEVLVATADVPVGGGVIAGGVVVTQPTEGEFRGFSSTCTHQGCQVASVADGVISCPCHGSRFSAEDGSVRNGPATAPLPEVSVAVEGEDVVRA
jgi:Rieske Fe-S protein